MQYQPNRKFDDVAHMNEMLIKYWNETVPPEATVIHHGDFAFASKNNIRKFRERLNGRIILILGNHDHYGEVVDIFGKENVRDVMFYTVEDQEIYSIHYPMASWKHAEEGS